jgi:hypothetical protein
MTVVEEHPTFEQDAEALFKEARRRGRRRRAVFSAAGLVVAGLIVACVAVLEGAGGSGTAPRAHRRSPALPAGAATVQLKQPAALAVSRTGVLYVVDPARDQILRRLRDGRFAVVAGSGRKGFSGDGGPAREAALRLDSNSSVAVGADGAVFFTDSGNNRVRAVLPGGRIRTVAGDGQGPSRKRAAPYLTGSRSALHADLVEPGGLAFGPAGKLYIAAQDVVALSREGTLSYFAGPISSRFSAEDHLIQGPGAGIAFDRAGDMFASSFPWLTERTAAGRILFLGDGFRQGILASSPDGIVYDAYGDTGGVFNRLIDPRPVPYGEVMNTRGLRSAVGAHVLNRVLAPTKRGSPNQFGPSGLAVGPHGTIYTDTDSGYWSSVSALVEITSGGHVHPLWTSR